MTLDMGKRGDAGLWESEQAESQSKGLHHITETQEISAGPHRSKLWSGRAMVSPSALQAGRSQRKEKRTAFHFIRLGPLLRLNSRSSHPSVCISSSARTTLCRESLTLRLAGPRPANAELRSGKERNRQ